MYFLSNETHKITQIRFTNIKTYPQIYKSQRNSTIAQSILSHFITNTKIFKDSKHLQQTQSTYTPSSKFTDPSKPKWKLAKTQSNRLDQRWRKGIDLTSEYVQIKERELGMTVVGHGGSSWRRDGHGGAVAGFALHRSQPYHHQQSIPASFSNPDQADLNLSLSLTQIKPIAPDFTNLTTIGFIVSAMDLKKELAFSQPVERERLRDSNCSWRFLERENLEKMSWFK